MNKESLQVLLIQTTDIVVLTKLNLKFLKEVFMLGNGLPHGNIKCVVNLVFHHFMNVLQPKILVQIHHKLRHNVTSGQQINSLHVFKHMKNLLLHDQLIHQKFYFLQIQFLHLILELQFEFEVNQFLDIDFVLKICNEIHVYFFQ